jgi:hypothetical protein
MTQQQQTTRTCSKDESKRSTCQELHIHGATSLREGLPRRRSPRRGGCVWTIADIGHIHVDRVGMHHHYRNTGDHEYDRSLQ